jgi:hypothetical protein
MKQLLLLSLALLGTAACTRRNEAKYCQEGTCTTPDFPFCDVSGAFSGEEGTCIAVTCVAGEFGECRGDREVRCNTTGTNYDVVQCERGCDPAASGCRLCSPSETACTNGALATCDANGAVTSMQGCALGCFEAQPRCRDIAPSNSLAKYLDMIQSPPDLDLSGGGVITTINGEITSSSGDALSIPNYLVPAPSGGVAIRVLVAKRVRLGNVTVTAGATDWGQGPALAILATDEITVEGLLDLTDWDRPSPGGVSFSACSGKIGNASAGSSSQTVISGSGGGGHATAGASGGNIGGSVALGGAGGSASGSETLEPLRGGCDSAGANTGGGAVQLSSRAGVTVTGTINVHGGAAYLVQDAMLGGGAGGGVLLEAPTVELGAGAALVANGGGGASGLSGASISLTLAASQGGACDPPSIFCGAGGNGAAVLSAAATGAAASYNAPATPISAGGGGGGLGRIRINTADGTYTKASSAIEAGSGSTGKLATR